MASATYRLLDQIKRIPGTDDEGKINAESLYNWLTEARQSLAHNGRGKIGDHLIGQLLAKAPTGDDDTWPCVPVCEALERIASPELADGFRNGVHNARGVHWRGEGGDQERELADRYRRYAQQRGIEYPFVGSVLESVAASYGQEARWQDSEAKVRKRLRH